MTRLQDSLGPEGAARLHAALVRCTLGLAGGAGLCPVELWCAPAADDPFFVRCADEYGVVLQSQRGADLGERMHHALATALQQAPYAVLLGTDCPSLRRNDLHEALHGLHKGSDAVMAPAEDGGYVLLGMRRADRSLFTNMPWGTDRVAAATRERMERLRWRWRELPLQWDVDRPEDLRRLTATGVLTGDEAPL